MRLELEPRAAAFPLTSTIDQAENPFAESQWNFESLLKKGMSAAQSGDRDQARKFLSQATAINPSSEEAWMWLASISEYPEELLAFLNRVLDINSANQKAVEWRTQTQSLLATTFVQRALGARNDGAFDLAGQYLDQALDHDAACESAWFWKASLADSDEQKVEFFSKVLEINPENTEARAALDRMEEARIASALENARVLVSNGQPEEASNILRSMIDHESAEIRESALMIMASAAATDDERIALYGQVLAINPNNSEAASIVENIEKTRLHASFDEARAAAAEGQSEKAISLLEGLLEKSPNYVDALLLISHLSTSLDAKVGALEKVLEIDPENAAARSGLAFMALTFGSSKPAEPSTPNAAVAVEEPQPQVVEESIAQPEDDSDVFADAYSDETIVTSIPAEQISDSVEFAYRQTEDSVQVDDEPANEVQVFEEPATTFEADSSESPFQAESFEPTQVWQAADIQMPASNGYSDQPRSVAEIFGPLESEADPESETVASFSPFATTPLNGNPFAAEERFESAAPEIVPEPEPETAPEPAVMTAACSFCSNPNEVQAIECSTCHSALTFADLESLLAGGKADKSLVQDAVTAMEAEWNTREFSSPELVNLSLGHFNLGNLESGFRYLQEASRLNPNDVILSGHANTVAIRLDEIRRQAEAVQSMPKGKTILVVDDSPTVRKLISGKLEKSGHNVVCAVDGVDALVKLEEGMPDLVLLDITMPRMDGYEVCKQIRANPAGKNLPVVMISGKDGFFDKVRGRMAGTSGYVTKPFGPETLMKALETYLLPDDPAVN